MIFKYKLLEIRLDLTWQGISLEYFKYWSKRYVFDPTLSLDWRLSSLTRWGYWSDYYNGQHHSLSAAFLSLYWMT